MQEIDEQTQEQNEASIPDDVDVSPAEEARGLVNQIRQFGWTVNIVADQLAEGRTDMCVTVAVIDRNIKGWPKVLEYLQGVNTGIFVLRNCPPSTDQEDPA